jgi:hypothetical protein
MLLDSDATGETTAPVATYVLSEQEAPGTIEYNTDAPGEMAPGAKENDKGAHGETAPGAIFTKRHGEHMAPDATAVHGEHRAPDATAMHGEHMAPGVTTIELHGENETPGSDGHSATDSTQDKCGGPGAHGQGAVAGDEASHTDVFSANPLSNDADAVNDGRIFYHDTLYAGDDTLTGVHACTQRLQNVSYRRRNHRAQHNKCQNSLTIVMKVHAHSHALFQNTEPKVKKVPYHDTGESEGPSKVHVEGKKLVPQLHSILIQVVVLVERKSSWQRI